MCCISASFDKDTLIELVKAGAYRGGHSFSFTAIDVDYVIKKLVRSFGDYNDLIETIEESKVDGCYMIVHQQAPTTTERGLNSIHPSYLNHTLLWHNGIIKKHYISKKEVELNNNYTWDTQLLHTLLNMSYNNLDSVEGSFACVYFDEFNQKLMCFRNAIAPLFVDNFLNISSVKFDNCFSISHNHFHYIDIKAKAMVEKNTFNSTESPYNI